MRMENTIQLINVEYVKPNRFQPRSKFDNDGLMELGQSIRIHGMIQPVIVRRVGPQFEIVAGERRFRAAQSIGMKQVPCLIVDIDDNEAAELAIIENTHRRELTPIEEARSYKQLLDKRYVNQEQLATRLGISLPEFSNTIRLLSLDESVQDALMNNKISEGHARSLLKVTDKMKQVELLNRIINERLTVKALEEVIDEVVTGYTKKAVTGNITAGSNLDINVDDIINNSEDITPAIPTSYAYHSRVDERTKNKKNSLFFNNLENESVNMDANISFGFNPFATDNTEEELDDVDYDLLDSDEEEEQLVSTPKVANISSPEQVVVEEKYESVDDTIAGIKKIIKLAKENGIDVEVEEFNFDLFYQFILRIDKEIKEKETNE